MTFGGTMRPHIMLLDPFNFQQLTTALCCAATYKVSLTMCKIYRAFVMTGISYQKIVTLKVIGKHICYL